MIEMQREAGRAEVFVPDNALVQCTQYEYELLRRLIRNTPEVESFYVPAEMGHRIVRHFPVPNITTLPEDPHGQHVPSAW